MMWGLGWLSLVMPHFAVGESPKGLLPKISRELLMKASASPSYQDQGDAPRGEIFEFPHQRRMPIACEEQSPRQLLSGAHNRGWCIIIGQERTVSAFVDKEDE